ncbi:6180_t:CDS:2, partial [Entrophospora sp. SA101]
MSLSLSHYDEYHKETNSEHVQNTSNTHQHGRPSSDSLNVNVKMDTEVISKENSATWNHLQESELETNHLLTNQIHELFPLFNQRSSNILGTNNGILKIVNIYYQCDKNFIIIIGTIESVHCIEIEPGVDTGGIFIEHWKKLFEIFNDLKDLVFLMATINYFKVNTPNTSNTISTDDLKIFVKTLSLTMLHNGPLDTSVMKFALGFENAINFE